MDSLVFKGNNGQVVTNSLLVAEKFGKKTCGCNSLNRKFTKIF